MKKELPKLEVNSFDELFSTEEQRIDAQLEKVSKIPLSAIRDFADHPFHVRMDEDMVKLIDSVQENGVLVPVLVRHHKDGNGYEMIAGHRRKYALEQAGFDTIDAIVRNLDDDQAVLLMVDSNIQRENILPTERAYAYKMRIDAMKHQGKRTDLTLAQVGPKLEYKKNHSFEQLAEAVGASRNQIKRYIRLTELIKPLQDMVDGIHEDGFTMALNPAYELSFLKADEQELVVKAIYDLLATPSLAQAQELKRRSQNGQLSEEFIKGLLSNEKANQKEKITFKMDEVDKYFPKSYTPKQKKDQIVKLLERWSKSRNEHTR